MPEIVAGQRIVVVDDSIVRGNTTRQIVGMLRDAGAAEVHLRISAPPIRHPCHYGVDMSTREEMIAHKRTVEEIADELGADSLAYLSIEGVYEAIGTPPEDHCDACFTGRYPLGDPEDANGKFALEDIAVVPADGGAAHLRVLDRLRAEHAALTASSSCLTAISSQFRIVVLASGSGTNLQAILDRLHGRDGVTGGRRRLRQARGAGAGACRRGRGRERHLRRRATTPTARRATARSATGASDSDADLVVLAGYMQLLSAGFVVRFRNRVVNVHPALLPAFPGLDAIGQALEAGVETTGVTVHFVDEGVDTGPAILQREVAVPPGARPRASSSVRSTRSSTSSTRRRSA